MSQKGIQKVAEIYFLLQNTKLELLSGDKQDMQLGHLLEKMKEETKDDFSRITMQGGEKNNV